MMGEEGAVRLADAALDRVLERDFAGGSLRGTSDLGRARLGAEALRDRRGHPRMADFVVAAHERRVDEIARSTKVGKLAGEAFERDDARRLEIGGLREVAADGAADGFAWSFEPLEGAGRSRSSGCPS